MRVKEESETASLKLNTKKINIMASGSITSWQIEGEKVEVFTEFLFLGFKITVDGDCCHEIRRLLLLGRKTMTNLNSVLKCRDITLPTKVHIVKAMVFPVVMYGCESWMWRRQCAEELMPSNYGAGENSWVSLGNQPWMFIARPDAEVETPVFWSSDANSWLCKCPWCWERLRAEAKEHVRGWDGWMISLIQWTWTWANFGRWRGTERPGVLQSMSLQRVGQNWLADQQQSVLLIHI